MITQEGIILTKNLRQNIVEYLEELEAISGIKVSDEQKEKIIAYVGTNNFEFTDPKEARGEFEKCRESLKEKWEEKGGYRWPFYFTAHHIIKINILILIKII